MLKYFFSTIIFLFLSSCGYEAMYSKNNSIQYNFSLSKLNFVGDRIVNLQIKQRLDNYTQDKEKGEEKFRLDITTTSEKITLVKDSEGNASSFKIRIKVYIEVFVNSEIRKKLNLEEDFNYNNNLNKFALESYEKQLKINLAETITNKLVLELSNIK